ncbi:MAG: arylesterase [Blastocatellia bacterium]|nr:arylesterase [Blastocatellia bacterium]
MHVVDHNFKSHLFKYFLLLAIALAGTDCQRSVAPAASRIAAAPAPSSTKNEDKREELPAIVAFGDSLTAGYGLSEQESYTTLLQQKLDEKNYRYRVINAGVSGDTSAGGIRRIDWALQNKGVKFLILELGGNDALRGQPVTVMKNNLAQIIERAQSCGVTVILAGMEAPPNLGQEYTRAYRQVFRDLARKYKLALIPFVLDGVGGKAELNQADGIHPNAEGEKIMTENVWRVLEPSLKH